jgi:uncharacterized protein DUF5591
VSKRKVCRPKETNHPKVKAKRGEAVRVHRNLHNGCWVVSTKSGGGWRVSGYATGVTLKNVRPRVGKSRYEACKANQTRNVHAYLEGDLVKASAAKPKGWKRITYNCKTGPGPYFYDPKTRKKFTGASEVRLVQGSKGSAVYVKGTPARENPPPCPCADPSGLCGCGKIDAETPHEDGPSCGDPGGAEGVVTVSCGPSIVMLDVGAIKRIDPRRFWEDSCPCVLGYAGHNGRTSRRGWEVALEYAEPEEDSAAVLGWVAGELGGTPEEVERHLLVNGEGWLAHELGKRRNPAAVSKARLKRRLASSGWTVRRPQTWLTVYTAPSGLVEIRDSGRPHPERYVVMTRYPHERHARMSHGASTFEDAVRVAIKDLGHVEPLPNPARPKRVRPPRPRSVPLPRSIQVAWAVGPRAGEMKGSTRNLTRGWELIEVPIDALFAATVASQRLDLEDPSPARVWQAKWHWGQGGAIDPSQLGLSAAGPLMFDDGRHRLVAAWQLGERTAPVLVPPGEAGAVLDLVGRHVARRPNPAPRWRVRSARQGLNAIKHPEITRNYRAALRFKPKHRVAVLLPCAQTKPFNEAPSYTGGYLRALEGKKADLWVVSEPLGVVPFAWSEKFPNAHYDFPPKHLTGEAHDLLAERVARWFKTVAPKYSKVVIALPGHHARLVEKALGLLDRRPATRLSWAGIGDCLDAGTCPSGHYRATSEAYRGYLRKRVRSNPPLHDFDKPIGPQAIKLAAKVFRGEVTPRAAGASLVMFEAFAETDKDRRGIEKLRETIESVSGRGAFLASLEGSTNAHVSTDPRWGMELMIHPAVRPDAPPGAWQITRFGPGEEGGPLVPYGHRYEPSFRSALEDAWREYGPLTVLAQSNPPPWALSLEPTVGPLLITGR